MALWIPQTLHVSEFAEINLGQETVYICAGKGSDEGAEFNPKSREEANAMAISLRLAAKRLEEIGKGLS